MRMLTRAIPVALAIALPSGGAWAVGSHKGGHHTFGEPGREGEVTRTVEVVADDREGMVYQMDLKSIRQGETIKFVVTNKGTGEHEFSVGDTGSQRAHAKLMKSNPGMKHEDDPAAVTLKPGETKTLIWKFNKPVQGDIVFACQMPGHYDAGMVHKVKLQKAKTG